MSDLTARSGVAPPGQTVNRILKGDRLPLVPAIHPDAVRQPPKINAKREMTSEPKLPIGCESLISSLADRPLARIAGSCVS
jgi:hypothetical protein